MQEKKTMTAFKEWCVKNDLTARVISESTGINLRSVRSYMQGARNPSRKTAKKLEEAYGVSAQDLFPL